MLDLYYTDIHTNLAYGSTCGVTNGAFAATVPANCVFTLVGQDPSKIVPLLNIAAGSNIFAISWPGPLTNYFVETTTDLTSTGLWQSLTIVPQLIAGRQTVTVAPTGQQQYFRLHNMFALPALPVLSITTGPNNFTISWPGALTNYFLETTTNLVAPDSWTGMVNAPQLAGGQLNVTLSPAAQQQFFRLHHY
jgi:hypothetical protein